MTRTCSDCPTPITPRAITGRCRSCARRAFNKTPEMRAVVSIRLSARNRDQSFRDRSMAARCKCPGWCPQEYAALNRKMERERFPLEERQRIIADDVAVRWRRLKALAA